MAVTEVNNTVYLYIVRLVLGYTGRSSFTIYLVDSPMPLAGLIMVSLYIVLSLPKILCDVLL